MKIGILYAGKTGTTEHCAQELATFFKDTTLVNLLVEKPKIEDYDLVIIGSAIRIGKIHTKVKGFLKSYRDDLSKKSLAIFICQGLLETSNGVVEQNFPQLIRKQAIIIKSFGGELKLERQKGLDRLMTKALMKNPQFKAPVVDYKAIQEFAEAIKHFLGEGV